MGQERPLNPNVAQKQRSAVFSSIKGVSVPQHQSLIMSNNIQNLSDNGVFVVKPDWITEPIRDQLREEFIQTCREFPEFEKPKDDVYVLGGFSALGNPASFHNPFVRKLRESVMWTVAPILKPLANGRNLEQIMDRMMFRTRGKVVASESWHRDEAPEAADEDDVFGGWINLDDTDHHFSCIPGSHKGVSKHSGFGKEKVVDSANKEKIRVPPGHIIIFFERILHEVNRSNVPPKGIVRLFLGWRLTNSTRSLYDLKDIFMNQAVPKLKSDQTPAMYSIYHRNVWVDALESFSATFKDNCIVKDNLKGRDVKIVPMHMKSLRSIGVPMYKEYTSRECLLYVPGKRWDLEVPCSETSRVDTLEF